MMRFADLPDALQDRIRRAVQPADPDAWLHQPIPALEHRSFAEVYGAGGEPAVADYLARVDALHGELTAQPQRAAVDAARTQPLPDLAAQLGHVDPTTPLVVRPSFRSPSAGIWVIARIPLALLLVDLLTGVAGTSTAHRLLTGVAVLVTAALATAATLLLARLEVLPDGTLVRRRMLGLGTRRYPPGSIERVRLSGADVTNPRWSSCAELFAAGGRLRFRLYLDYWAPQDVARLAAHLGAELFDDRPGATRPSLARATASWAVEDRWRLMGLLGGGMALIVGLGVLALAAAALWIAVLSHP